MNTMKLAVAPAVLLACALLFASCDALHDQLPPEATVILGVRVTPDPIPAGTEATIRISISDSTATGLKYSWNWARGYSETTTPEYVWTAPAEPGMYRFEITVSRRDSNPKGYRNVGTVLHLTVVPKS